MGITEDILDVFFSGSINADYEQNGKIWV